MFNVMCWNEKLIQNCCYVTLGYLLGFPNFNPIHFAYFIYFVLKIQIVN